MSMVERQAIRQILTMMPLVGAQWGICRALRGKRAYPWAVGLAVTAVVMNVLNSWWLFGFRFKGTFWDVLSGLDTAGQMWLFTCLPAYLIYVVCRWMGKRAPETVSPERRKLLHSAGALAIATPFAAMTYGVLVGRLDFRVREVELPIPGLHPDLEGLRVLHLSDIHLGQFLSEKDFARVVDMANGLKPHLAIMTGDLISKPGDPMEVCVKQLARVRADAGMVGCLGNHEMYSEMEAAVKKEAARRGIPFLRQENRQLRFGAATMNVGGVDYQRVGPRKDYLKGAEKLMMPGAMNLLLSHNPDVFPVAAEQGWDLTLAGHTHGGQVTLEVVEQNVNVCRFFTPFVAGEYHLGKAGCYVTRGIGTVGLPARVGVPPEITLLRLKRA